MLVSGLSRTAPKKTLSACLTLLTSTYGNRGTIYVTGTTIAAALPGFVTISSGDIIIAGLDGTPFYWTRAFTESGWSSEGGGVYSTARVQTVVRCLVPTIADGDFYLELDKNTSTPSTPAAGEFGMTGGNIYVHLPGDADDPRAEPRRLAQLGKVAIGPHETLLRQVLDHGIIERHTICDRANHPGVPVVEGPKRLAVPRQSL